MTTGFNELTYQQLRYYYDTAPLANLEIDMLGNALKIAQATPLEDGVAWHDADGWQSNAVELAHCILAYLGRRPQISTDCLHELVDAAWQAFGAFVGAHAADDSVQGRARDRLRNAVLEATGPVADPAMTSCDQALVRAKSL